MTDFYIDDTVLTNKPVWEMEGSLQETTDPETGVTKCSVQLRCRWADRWDVSHHLRNDTDKTSLPGFPGPDPPVSPDTWLFGRVWPYQIDPGDADLRKRPRVKTVKIRPEGCDSAPDVQHFDYEHAILDVEYSNDQIFSNYLVSETLAPGGEFLKYPYTLFKWATTDDPLVDGEEPGWLRPSLIYTRVTRHAYALDTGITTADPVGLSHLKLVGSTNKHPYAIGDAVGEGGVNWINVEFPAETMLYYSPVYRQVIRPGGVINGPTGSVLFNIVSRLEYRENTWNKFYRLKTNTWDTMIDSAGDPVTPYKPLSWNIAQGWLGRGAADPIP